MFSVLRRLCCLLLAVFITRAKASLSPPDPCLHNQRFDFEPAIPGQKGCFHPMPASKGSVTLSSIDLKTIKNGGNSLKWTTSGASKLQLKAPTFTIPNAWLRNGGMKVWIYKVSPSPGQKLGVVFTDTSTRTTTGRVTIVAKFKADLNFAGWRGIWVKFEECKVSRSSLSGSTVIDEIKFVLSGIDTIYIDILEFKENLARQSRDKIVPPIRGLTLYDKSNTWQQTYRWSQQPVPTSPLTVDPDKKKSLNLIKSRLKNYYCDETKTTSSFSGFLKKRWSSLLRGVNKAHQLYDTTLTFAAGGSIIGPPLFCRDCKLGTKFGYIFETILLPLALEYHIRSRTNEVTKDAKKLRRALISGTTSRILNAKIAIAGQNTNMQTLLTGFLPSSRPPSLTRVKSAIDSLNLARLSKIKKLLDFVKQQGFSDGSGLGSLDHEMNLDGAGFMHTLFLISDSISKSRLLDWINTAKWYNDFGEIYQSPTFEFKGTTADRMITLLLFRLIIVLVMPSSNVMEWTDKIRDMEALVRWMNNALAVNEGLGGVIKPDYTGYHHKAFYASAYVPQALHNAAFVQYLLGGTSFKLSPSSTDNIKRGLETLRIVAVKYSTPASLGGRFPHYFNNALIKALLPGYAYISVSHPATLPVTIPTGISVSHVNLPETKMFWRLYDDPASVDSYLEDGRPSKGKYYFNSLGSLEIMEAVKSIVVLRSIPAEPSPQGHWSKNFAALSVHRREDWAVTVKGFNRFVWDYESSNSENVYGLFASHGALLIANSETKLQVHDVENGWDWAKIPGTTTIDMGNPDIEDLNIGKVLQQTGRFYNQHKLAGGLTFKGTMSMENGLFGMNFRQPNYGSFPPSDWRQGIDFHFKKSVFIFENLLVCLGSDITALHTGGRLAQTTLFQDKLAGTSSITVDGSVKTSSPSYTHVVSPSPSYTTLNDAKGNFYYIPSPSKSILHVSVKSQTSKSDDGKRPTSETYGTAWFEHNTANPSYEYAVLIPTTTYHTRLTDLATDQETAGREVYEVLQKDSTAHVVKFLKSPETWLTLGDPITGYVLFTSATSLPAGGPVARVTKGDCLVMAQETAGFIYLSISYPDLNFGFGPSPPANSDDVGEKLLYRSASRAISVKVTLRKKVTAIALKNVHGTPSGYTPTVVIEGKGKVIRFSNLKNGFSVEVKLTK